MFRCTVRSCEEHHGSQSYKDLLFTSWWSDMVYQLTAISENIFTDICCGTFRLCVSPLVALWPIPNPCLTLWGHSAFWGSPLSDLIHHNTSSQAAGSPSFSGCRSIVSPSLHRYAALILSFHSHRTLKAHRVYGCQTWQITHCSYKLLLNRLISLMVSSFITALYSLVQPLTFPQLLPHCLL